MRTPDAVMSIGSVILLPLTFMSNVFVEPDAIAVMALVAANHAAVPTPGRSPGGRRALAVDVAL